MSLAVVFRSVTLRRGEMPQFVRLVVKLRRGIMSEFAVVGYGKLEAVVSTAQEELTVAFRFR